MNVYYNENDSTAADWLRSLIKARLIPAGDVDERSIQDVKPIELAGYDQCHFFAGIGGWPYALQLAGWDGPVWTGSCPCQPFSAAGARKGADDDRHLWPHWRWLIDQCRPITVFGEQVASKDGREWLAGVCADLDLLGYGFGAADICAAGVGAPHKRQRLFWMADTECNATEQRRIADKPGECAETERTGTHAEFGRCGGPGGLADANTGNTGLTGAAGAAKGPRVQPGSDTSYSGAWSDHEWIKCADGKARRIKPGLEPLAHGVPGRVAQLRGLGNAIVPQVAAEFVAAYMEAA